MKFPVRIYLKEWHPVYPPSDPGFFWKSLCIVYDNEALGILERLLGDMEHKVESVDAK